MMVGAARIPSQRSLSAAYASLLHSKPRQPELKRISLYSQWARFDPRLAEILVQHFSANWQSFNPMELRALSLVAPWPSVVAVLLEFARKLVRKNNDRETCDVFDRWKDLATTGLQKGSNEQFFFGLRQIGETAMWEDALFSTDEYRRWGYLARENLVSKQKGAELSSSTRQQILLSLLNDSSRIRTRDYWNAIGRGISYRQAERDLRRSKHLRSSGNTKGRYYLKK